MTEGEGFEADNDFFKRMLNLIPPKVYFDREVQEKLLSRSESKVEDRNGHTHNVGDDEEQPSSNKRKKKEKSKKNKKEKKAGDPFMSKSVSQIQEEDLTVQPTQKFTEIKHKKQKRDNLSFVPSTTPVASGSGNLDDNRSKLRTKIEQFQAKRNVSDENSQEAKRLKRRELKMKKKAKKLEKKKANSTKVQNNEAVKGDNPKQNKTPSKPIYNKDGNLVFSKFDFTSSGKKKRNSDLTGKDYKRLLEKIEKRNEKLQTLKNRDASAAMNLQEKFKWDAALHKAEGEKVKDNPELLRKALKQKEKIREKKKKKWEDRTKVVEKQKDAKQAKRTKNLNARIQTKKEKKMKRLIKKGRSVPGF